MAQFRARRHALQTLAALALSPVAGMARAQAWPTQPITLVVPFPPGGTTDVIARALGDRLAQALGQRVIVDNRPGAGATLGANLVAKSRPDGHTLLMGAVHHTIASSVFRRLPYDFQRDFAPVSTVALVPNVLVVNAATPAQNVRELVALARARPGHLNFGSNGNGTAQHLIGTLFQRLTGTDIAHIPYGGSGPLITALLGAQVTMSFDTVTPVLPHVRNGRLRALAVTTARRSSALPEVPTLHEAGLAGFDIGTWFGVLAPAATPRDVVARLNDEIVKAINAPDLRRRLEEIGAEPVGNSPEAMARQIADETTRFAELVRTANVVIE